MEIVLSPGAKKDIQYWKKSGQKPNIKKIEKLLASMIETPFEGIGKPEPLKNDLSGCWSRRIDEVHRIVYTVEGDIIHIFSLRGHYNLF
jgi:toxin YoeB